MALSTNTYKALIATALFSSAVVFLGFTMHIKKSSELIAETFYELDAESPEEEQKEELNDILKSLDDILATTTNQAYNETQKYDEIDEDAFNERLEAIQNRNSASSSSSEAFDTSGYTPTQNAEEASKFSDINDLISEKKEAASAKNAVNKNSSIVYSLVNRTKIDIPPPIYLCEKAGKIVINITVNSRGDVVDAYYNNASTSKDGCMVDHALEYAKAAKFNADASKLSQLGSITFYFKGK